MIDVSMNHFVYSYDIRPLITAAMVSPLRSDEYCQKNTPADHPTSFLPLVTALPNSPLSIHPVLVASFGVTGLPTTILFIGTPR